MMVTRDSEGVMVTHHNETYYRWLTGWSWMKLSGEMVSVDGRWLHVTPAEVPLAVRLAVKLELAE